MKRFLPVATLAILACGGGDRDQRAVIQNKGSDTLLNVAQAWAEAYSAVNPNVAVAVTGGGATGVSAMINAPRHRKLVQEERKRNRAARANGASTPSSSSSGTMPWPSTSTRTTRSRA